jgi:UDP-N-acetylglucosamine--N-acetylmuramyl-(pentapeptide) pyrophosphoryl-undecaprenol N-acetylglucosamine transferase
MISGGGTGGHIYPAIAIANAWKEKYPDAEILFVGAEGRMEMQKVPEAGYKIEGLKVAGLQRSLTLSNLSFPFKLINSLLRSKQLIQEFKPDAVVGVGGYASGPLLFVAQQKGIPTLIQEQNSYAGLTNKLLAKKAKRICVAYPGMEKFFPKEALRLTGNPVRKDLLEIENKREEAMKFFGFEAQKKVVLILGGSLGARTINQSVLASVDSLVKEGYQVLWQCGKFYFVDLNQKVSEMKLEGVHLLPFVQRMDLAYAVADIVISRAGALSVSELSLVGKPVIFIPSPNVAEDHQTKNAMAVVSNEGAELLKDPEAVDGLLSKVMDLMKNEERLQQLAQNIKKLAKPEAANEIVNALEEIIQ